MNANTLVRMFEWKGGGRKMNACLLGYKNVCHSDQNL